MIVFFKIICALVIILASSYLGYNKASLYSKREKVIRDFSIFFNRIKAEILYTQNTVPNLIENNRQDLYIDVKNSLGAISTDMLINESKFSIEKSIEKNINEIKCLEETDKNYIIKGLNFLGKTDIEGQQSIIENTISLLDIQIKDAKDMENKNSKLYKKLGILLGIFLVVIVI